MTFEEMQQTIEGMLAVQRELQESQLQLKESQRELRDRQLEFERSQQAQKAVLDELIQRYGDMAAHSIRQREILDRLLGYSLTSESNHLDLEEKLQALETRIKRLENPN